MSKQEKIVCAAVKFILGHVSQDRTIEEIALCVKYDDNFAGDLFQRLSSKIYWGIESYQQGFITNKNRFVDPVEAMKISVNNKNRIDYEISGEMDRMRKDLAKATNSRNRGTIGAEVGLKLLEDKYFGLESVLNEFRGRNHLKPEDLY